MLLARNGMEGKDRKDTHLGSPQFLALIDRLVKNGLLSSEERRSLAEVFRLAVELEGWREFGFKRPIGQSFNPRPARIVHILIEDAGVTDLKLLKNAIECAGEMTDSENSLVQGAILLDRIRHLHQEAFPDWKPIIKHAESILPELPESRLAVYLKKGIERIQNKFGEADGSR